VLFESHLGKGGSVYEELADYPLQILKNRVLNPEYVAS